MHIATITRQPPLSAYTCTSNATNYVSTFISYYIRKLLLTNAFQNHELTRRLHPTPYYENRPDFCPVMKFSLSISTVDMAVPSASYSSDHCRMFSQLSPMPAMFTTKVSQSIVECSLTKHTCKTAVNVLCCLTDGAVRAAALT